MSDYYYLLCKETNECIEVIALVGAKPGPRIEANALQAFLLYHHIVTGPYKCPSFTIENIDSIGEDPYRSIVKSLDEFQQDIEMNSWTERYATPILVWTEDNYRSLSARTSELNIKLSAYESAASGGLWVRKTIDGRII